MADETTDKRKKPAPAAVSKTIEAWAQEKAVDPAFFAVAKAITPSWGVGRECDEATFDTVMQRAKSLELRP